MLDIPVDPDAAGDEPSAKEEGDEGLDRVGGLGVLRVQCSVQYYTMCATCSPPVSARLTRLSTPIKYLNTEKEPASQPLHD